MAKLSDEQKALNKEATRLRDRAFTARRTEFRNAEEKVLAEIHEKHRPLLEKVSKNLDDAMHRRNETAREIEAKIAALQQQLKTLQEQQQVVTNAAAQERTIAYDAWRKEQQEAQKQIQQEFADIAPHWSAAGWKNFKDFLPEAQKNLDKNKSK
jgi:polyphosphate kinase